MWLADLDWDYAPIRHILVAFIKQKLLPGYVAVADSKALAYTYFLINQSKGVIGTLYAMNAAHSQEAVDELLGLDHSSLWVAYVTYRSRRLGRRRNTHS